MRDPLADDATLLATIEADTVSAYMRRGRSLQHVADNELHQQWAKAATALLSAPSREAAEHEEDARAELLLRGIAPDFEAVLAEFSAAVNRICDSMRLADPAAERAIEHLRTVISRRH